MFSLVLSLPLSLFICEQFHSLRTYRTSESNIEENCMLDKSKPPGGTPYNGLYGEAPPERGTFFRLQVYKRVGISQVEIYKRVGKSVI